VKKVGAIGRARGAILGLGAIAALGCSDGSAPQASRPVVSIGAGEWSVRVDPDNRRVTLSRGDEERLAFPADGFELGTLETVDDATNYDPWPLFEEVPFYPAPEVKWLSPTRIDVAQSTDTALELALSYPSGHAATLRIEAAADGRFSASLVPGGGADDVAYVRFRPRIDAEEGLYGLGEHFDDVNQRGKLRAMQIEIDSSIESGYNEVHVPVPLLIGTTGWGLFVENRRPAVFAVATESADLVDVVFGTGTASKEGVVFHLFGAPHPLDVTRHYYDVTGYPRLPARWALGPWVWRDENKDQAEVLADIAAMRALDLPTTGYWIDRPYASGVNSFDFNPAQFPDPQGMIDEMHAQGFRTALWHTPYIDEEDPATKALLDEAIAAGYLPPVSGLNLNKWGTALDLTNPAAYAWWQALIRKYTDMGVEGFKLDYAEDVVPGLTSARNEWRFADGSDERTMHGAYQLFYHRVYAETLPESGGFLLCRHSTFGDQENGVIVWPGDLEASFTDHREKTTNASGDSYVSVGGLPAALVASLSLGPSGFPFFGSDTGGYRHSPPDKELFVRWFEHTALSSVMQIGNSANTVAWEFDPATGYDAEMLDWYRTYTRLHLRLFPYEWTLAEKLLEDGRPIQRPLGLAHPELGVHPSDTYLFGDDLLVAPVTKRGVVERSVMLPAGAWIDWWTGERHEGGKTITASAPLETLPLYLREGGIVPMLRPTIDTLAPTDNPVDVDSYATTPGLVWARVAPSGSDASAFTIFDGTKLDVSRTGGVISLGYAGGAELALGAVFEVVALGKAPMKVSVDSAAVSALATKDELDTAPSGFFYDAAEAGGTLYVKVGAGSHAASVEL